MAELIAIVGRSGTGKTTSLRTLNPKETSVISCSGKAMPIPGWKKNYTPLTKEGGNYFKSRSSTAICATMQFISDKRPEIKQIVIDDFYLMMSLEFFDRAQETGFQKFNDLGQHFVNVISKAESLREDLKVIFLTHEEDDTVDYERVRQIKTIGKMVREKLCPEAMFTVVLFTKVNKEDGDVTYHFITNTDGTTTAKSPMGMFKDELIPNDLAYVCERIDSYYNDGAEVEVAKEIKK